MLTISLMSIVNTICKIWNDFWIQTIVIWSLRKKGGIKPQERRDVGRGKWVWGGTHRPRGQPPDPP